MKQPKQVPRGEPTVTGIDYMAVEITDGSRWIDLNDGYRFKISSEETRDSTSKTWRKTVATSPVLGGDYLIHAVPEMVAERLSIWVYGQDQTDLADNYYYLEDLFTQFDYRIRWTFNEYREYWHCQLADGVSSRGQVLTHNAMAKCSYTVPRYPQVTRERIN